MAARNRGRKGAGAAGKSRVVPAQRRGERANAAANTPADDPPYEGKSIQQQVADRRRALLEQQSAGVGADDVSRAVTDGGRRPSARRAAVTRRSTDVAPARPQVSDAKVAARREKLAAAVYARCERARTGDAAEKVARMRELVHLRSYAYDAEFFALLSDLEREHDVERTADEVADAIAPEIELAALPADAAE